MATENPYKFLESRAGSNYRQLFVQARKIRAELLYRATIGPEPRTPEEVAQDYGVPVEAVHEAICYCLRHEALLRQERHEVMTDIQARGLNKPPLMSSHNLPEA